MDGDDGGGGERHPQTVAGGLGLVIDTSIPGGRNAGAAAAAAGGVSSISTSPSTPSPGIGRGGGGSSSVGVRSHSPFSPVLSPMGTPRELLPQGPLPYGGDEDLEKAITVAMKNKDTKAWKLLIKARTVRNNLTTAAVSVACCPITR